MRQPINEFDPCLYSQWAALRVPLLWVSREVSLDWHWQRYESWWYKYVYHDFNTETYLFAHYWIAWLLRIYWRGWMPHKYDGHRWLLKRGIFGLKEDGAYLNEWHWNHPRYWFKGEHYTSDLTVKQEKK